MSTTKKRITTYVPEKTVRKFKIISATKNLSMSEYTEKLIQNLIDQYEADHGEIKITEEGGAEITIWIDVNTIFPAPLEKLRITLILDAPPKKIDLGGTPTQIYFFGERLQLVQKQKLLWLHTFICLILLYML